MLCKLLRDFDKRFVGLGFALRKARELRQMAREFEQEAKKLHQAAVELDRKEFDDAYKRPK